MNTTRRQLLVRAVQALCALPLVGVRIAESKPVKDFMFEQKALLTTPVSVLAVEADADYALQESAMFLEGAMKVLLSECERDGFVLKKIGISWEPSEHFLDKVGHFKITAIRKRVA